MAQTYTTIRAVHNATVPRCACIYCALGPTSQVGARMATSQFGVLSADLIAAFIAAVIGTVSAGNICAGLPGGQVGPSSGFGY